MVEWILSILCMNILPDSHVETNLNIDFFLSLLNLILCCRKMREKRISSNFREYFKTLEIGTILKVLSVLSYQMATQMHRTAKCSSTWNQVIFFGALPTGAHTNAAQWCVQNDYFKLNWAFDTNFSLSCCVTLMLLIYERIHEIFSFFFAGVCFRPSFTLSFSLSDFIHENEAKDLHIHRWEAPQCLFTEKATHFDIKMNNQHFFLRKYSHCEAETCIFFQLIDEYKNYFIAWYVFRCDIRYSIG